MIAAGKSTATVGRVLPVLRGAYLQFGKRGLIGWDQARDIRVLPGTLREYRLRNQAPAADSGDQESKPADAPTGATAKKKPKPDTEKPAA